MEKDIVFQLNFLDSLDNSSYTFTDNLHCPECGEELLFNGRCKTCPECGWSGCDI